jgi:hypothetical protein
MLDKRAFSTKLHRGFKTIEQAIATVAEATTVDEPSRWCRGGIMTRMKATALAITVSTLLACQHSPAPTAPTEPVAGRVTVAPAESAGVEGSTTGGGHYLLQNAFDTQFAFSAVLHGDGSATGNFHQRLESGTGTVDFRGRVTCMAVDAANHRAWVGGVIEKNESTDPSFLAPQHQVGHDIWFRVLDNGQAEAATDRTTFVGFEGVIPSSAAYCHDRIWPDDNARTWPVTSGNITVKP